MSIEVKGLAAAIIAGVVVVGGTFFIAALVRATAPQAISSPASQSPIDPADLQAEIISGGQHFSTSCSGCHGADGSGGGGAPDLHNEQLSDSDIAAIITSGKGPMPAFANTYNSQQIKSLVAYIRSLH